MKKENVTKFSLEAAFKALDEIDIPDVSKKGRCTPNRVNLRERLNAKPATDVLIEDFFDINNQEDLGNAQEEREAEIAKAKLARIEKIVDLDAESEEDILPSYVGKFIIQCPQCMTLFYKNEEDIEDSEENPDVVNINETCQHCGNASGYTLVGKVGSVEEDEMANFDLEDTELADEEPAEEEAIEEPAEEEAAETAGDEEGEAGEEDTDEFDLDLNLDDLGEEPETEANESVNKSKLLKDFKKKNDLKSKHESENLTLNEDMDKDSEGLSDEAFNSLLDELWGSEQPSEAEVKADLASFDESIKEADILECAEDLDEVTFNEHFNHYMTETYSNVKNFKATSCTIEKNQLVVEGVINFNSGKTKKTSFIFENSPKGLLGRNKDFAAGKAFLLKTNVINNTLFTEGLKYKHFIGESLVKGTIYNK